MLGVGLGACEKSREAPRSNTAARAGDRGRVSLAMGRGSPERQQREASELAQALKAGSLPAPLREETVSSFGPVR
jgi:preprotein translocase subunit SecD